jgi:dolichol-phosphate mannosyltransferase
MHHPASVAKAYRQDYVAVSEFVRSGPALTVVVPTFNEADNVVELVDRLRTALVGVDWEVVFVDDDSPDGTAETVRRLALDDARVRCIQRLGRRGLSSACVEGMLASSAPYVAVIDADLQHDETVLPRMLDALRDDAADLAVGSRYVDGGGFGALASGRVRISRFATRLARWVLGAELSDPMSGFFMLRRGVFERAMREMSNLGFKILVDLLASSRAKPRIVELPYTFRNRVAGESKLDNQAAWDFLMLLADKLVGRWIPVRFVAFTIVGGLDVIVHFAILSLVFQGLSYGFVAAQSTATLAAMTFNFVLNNELTYRDIRLRGWRWLRGWASFSAACGVGAFANVGVATYLFDRQAALWALAALAGIMVGAVWNYAVTAYYTWKPRAR